MTFEQDYKKKKIKMKTINGKIIASELNEKLSVKISKLKNNFNTIPHLVVIIVGENPASKLYVKNKSIAAERVGIKSTLVRFEKGINEKKLLDKIEVFNKNKEVDGILVQLPLPPHINKERVIDKISFEKDVDGFHSLNIGLLAQGRPRVIPCTPLGCLKLINKVTDITGKNIIIIGRSNIVGKPLSYLLTLHDATVTLAHSKSQNLKDLCKNKDIVIAATGIPEMIEDSWVNKNTIVIDVGINEIFNKNKKRKLVGDVNFEKVMPKVKAITPVPGGVGPMTIHCLLANTFELALKRRKLKIS